MGSGVEKYLITITFEPLKTSYGGSIFGV